MGEIRSAWEIAQQKADKLGGLSQEEKRKQKEERSNQIGKSLAEKYLERENVKYLETELNKYDGQDRELMTQAILERLVEGIDFRYGQTLEKINSGILAISDNRTRDIVNQIGDLFREYQEAEAAEKQNIEKTGKDILHQMRISGTAIGEINIRANAEWQRGLDQLSHPFEEKLKNLKQELLSL